jgi:hypothetical protein
MGDPSSAASQADVEAPVAGSLVRVSLAAVEVLAARTRRSTGISLDVSDSESSRKIAAAASASAKVAPLRAKADEVDDQLSPEHAELNHKSETLRPSAVQLLEGREGLSPQRSRADVDGSERSPDMVDPQPSGDSSGSAPGASSGSTCGARSASACGVVATPDQFQLFFQKQEQTNSAWVSLLENAFLNFEAKLSDVDSRLARQANTTEENKAGLTDMVQRLAKLEKQKSSSATSSATSTVSTAGNPHPSGSSRSFGGLDFRQGIPIGSPPQLANVRSSANACVRAF